MAKAFQIKLIATEQSALDNEKLKSVFEQSTQIMNELINFNNLNMLVIGLCLMLLETENWVLQKNTNSSPFIETISDHRSDFLILNSSSLLTFITGFRLYEARYNQIIEKHLSLTFGCIFTILFTFILTHGDFLNISNVFSLYNNSI